MDKHNYERIIVIFFVGMLVVFSVLGVALAVIAHR
jgi:hypothetical protein